MRYIVAKRKLLKKLEKLDNVEMLDNNINADNFEKNFSPLKHS